MVRITNTSEQRIIVSSNESDRLPTVLLPGESLDVVHVCRRMLIKLATAPRQTAKPKEEAT